MRLISSEGRLRRHGRCGGPRANLSSAPGEEYQRGGNPLPWLRKLAYVVDHKLPRYSARAKEAELRFGSTEACLEELAGVPHLVPDGRRGAAR